MGLDPSPPPLILIVVWRTHRETMCLEFSDVHSETIENPPMSKHIVSLWTSENFVGTRKNENLLSKERILIQNKTVARTPRFLALGENESGKEG